MKKDIIYQEIEIWELEDLINKEIMIILYNRQQYFGILKDIDDDELILSRPDSKLSLGFQLSWLANAFVKEDLPLIK